VPLRSRKKRLGLPHPRQQLVRIDDDSNRTHGWQARWSAESGNAPWPVANRYRSRLFSDLKHGGRLAARRAAIRFLRAVARRARPLQAFAPPVQRRRRRRRR